MSQQHSAVRNSWHPYLAWLLMLLTSCCSAEEPVQFNRDIRPILSENCFYCHGFDKDHREADLRLDTREGATDYAIVPGEPDESELLIRILSSDKDQVMPPPESEKHLSREEIALVRRWIKEGAEYQEHWAWTKLTRPQVDGAKTGADTIDTLLKAGWIENEATPVGMATARERLRRLSFDLRGIAPSYDDVIKFAADPTAKHFYEFRDQWMTELAYAEHQAVRWLDLVRWADTSGFVSDEPIASGAYRAWIINAFRDNMRFDQFSIEQLAGDLLDDPTDDQFVASGYNRIVNTNCEAGGIEEEQLYKLKGEHVRAVGTVWLGMTTGCAECHDHKFDPFSAKDYYSLAAFFDDLVEAGVYTPGDRREPLHYVHDTADRSRTDRELAAEIRKLRQRIAAKPLDDLKGWEEATKAKLGDKNSRTDFVWLAAQLPAPRVLEGDYQQTTVEGRTARKTSAPKSVLHRHHAAELMTGYLTLGNLKTDAAKDAIFVNAWIDPKDRPEMIGVQISHGKYGRLGWQTANYETYYWGEDKASVLGQEHPWSNPKRVKKIDSLPDESGWVRLRVPYSKLVPRASSTYESVGMAWLHVGGTVAWGDSGLEIRADKAAELLVGETGIRKWWESPMNRQFYQSRIKLMSGAIRTKPESRSELQQELVADAFREGSQTERMTQLRALESRLFVMRARAMPVLVSRKSDQPKTTRLVHRGDYQDKTGPIMSAAIPEFLGDVGPDANRLDLARWLFAKENPLVARVFVNRLWHQFFGRGLSETLEDSGTQGDWPSNVVLLDWLASEFRDSGWDRNHMIRLLTSTRAYQMSSVPTKELAHRDPGNRWHARQGRFRLTAESVRDTALQAAGLLQSTSDIPMHSFFPYQPDPYWTRSDKVMYGSRHLKWETSRLRTQYQRSMYAFWKRQNIHPTMLAFDAPTRQECTAKRNITNTAGQALALLNDPIFVEAARVLAAGLCEEAGVNDEYRIGMLFAKTLQRNPAASERQILSKLLTAQRAHYAAHPELAKQLLQIGNAPSPKEDLEIEVAAWTAVSRSVLNLHEFLNRQ